MLTLQVVTLLYLILSAAVLLRKYAYIRQVLSNKWKQKRKTTQVTRHQFSKLFWRFTESKKKKETTTSLPSSFPNPARDLNIGWKEFCLVWTGLSLKCWKVSWLIGIDATLFCARLPIQTTGQCLLWDVCLRPGRLTKSQGGRARKLARMVR